MFVDWFEGDCIDVCYHSKTDVRRGVALIEDLRIARFPYVSAGSPQGVESPSGRLCLVWGGIFFPHMRVELIQSPMPKSPPPLALAPS